MKFNNSIPLDVVDDIIDYGRRRAAKNKGMCNIVLTGMKHEAHDMYDVLQPYIDKHKDLQLCALREGKTKKIYLYIKVRLINGLEGEV
jgi:hypothetical protein